MEIIGKTKIIHVLLSVNRIRWGVKSVIGQFFMYKL